MDSTLPIDVLNGVRQAREELRRYDDRAISVITWIEVMAGARKGEEARMESFLGNFKILELSPAIAAEAAHVRRTTRLKLPDAVLLATAHIENRVLLTRNSRDFAEGRFVRIPYMLQ